jgi:hypothetical protein
VPAVFTDGTSCKPYGRRVGLGHGSYQGSGAARHRRIYDTGLWKPALCHGFPDVGDLDRALVEAAARRVQSLRNRIAHHEHIVWGVPGAGEGQPDGTAVRLSVNDAHGTLISLAGSFDEGFADWLRQYSEVPVRLAACPVDAGELCSERSTPA